MNSRLYKYLSDDAFKELRDELKRKYINYGECVGIINLTPKTRDVTDKLAGFLSKSIVMNRVNKISVKDIQKCLDDSSFNGTSVDDIVLMFNPDIKSNKQLRLEKKDFIDSVVDDYKSLYGKSNIKDLFNNEDALKKIKYYIVHNKLMLDNILKSLNELPFYTDDFEFLAIFATNTVGNPHYYDLDTTSSNLLIKFICLILDIEFKNSRRFKIDILENVGIGIDNVSNNVITYNLYGNDMLDVFKDNMMPLTLTLANIYKINPIKAFNNILLIVENPSFISKIIDKKINYSVIVTSGNSNMVVYKLLDKLKNAEIYFNGDFDPEGLLIAQKLMERYSNIKLIGYDIDYYKNGISNNKISEKRLKKLNSIKSNDLKQIKELLLKNKLSSYQEANYDMILSDMSDLNRGK